MTKITQILYKCYMFPIGACTVMKDRLVDRMGMVKCSKGNLKFTYFLLKIVKQMVYPYLLYKLNKVFCLK